MELNAPQPYLIEFAPSSLHKMLVREAAFALSRRRLTEALNLAREREREIKATRPPFMILLPTKAKQEFTSNLEESRDTLSVLQAGLDKLNLLEPELLAQVAFRLENHLRRSSSDYVHGLSENRYPTDWARLRIRFDECARDYHTTLNALANLCAIMPPHEAIGTPPTSRQLLTKAISLGDQLEAEVEFINKISHAQRKRAGHEGFTLKLQAGVNWKESAQSLLGINAKAAPRTLLDLIAQSEKITAKILAEVSDESTLTLSKSSHDIASYHLGQWSALREAALLKINPEELESLVKETETLLETGEFKRWAILDEPPVTAPPPKPGGQPAKPAPETVHAPKPPPRTNDGPTLKLSPRTTRPPFPSKPAVTAPAPIPAASAEEINALATAKAELERQTQLLQSLKAELDARESFVSESENRLLEKTLAQQEQEAELEQRSEELEHLEKRVRQLQANIDPATKARAAELPPRVFNEFLE